MDRLFLLTQIAGTEVAICSNIVESVVSIGEVSPVPRCDPVIAGLFALRSRVLTLIDCQYRVTGVQAPIGKGALAAIASIGGHSFGLLVEKVYDVVTVSEDAMCPAVKLGEGWTDIVSSLLAIDGRLVMVIDPDRLVATGGMRAAA
ncbi:chemotaxis protein CheW [Sphingorhabdus sp.]|jgi:purine-binding chemotaxis protein CheW|uniref:chemotaxis protein CheW n=1 Tax=Sphingorhabdus sp. TaxID=1902408 RepID=UPI0035B3A3A0|nr:chemotaxis protein CheW [Sphingomonadaceae bacterium]